MVKKKIIIFSIKGKKYGHGHFIRSKNLKNNLSNSKTLIKNINFESPNKFKQKLREFFSKNETQTTFIFDISNYFFFNNKKIIQTLKIIFNKNFKIVIIDGFDRNCLRKKIYNRKIKYIYPYFSNINKKNIFSGTKYFVFNKHLRRISKEITKSHKRILVTFGGSDPYNSSTKFAKLLSTNFPNIYLSVVIGPSFSQSNIKSLKKIKNIRFLKYKNNPIKYFNSHDFFITSGGLTKYELSLTNKPILVYIKTKYEIKENKSFKEKNLAFYLNSRNSDKQIINFFKKNLNRKISNKVIIKRRNCFDHKGSQRIVNIIK